MRPTVAILEESRNPSKLLQATLEIVRAAGALLDPIRADLSKPIAWESLKKYSAVLAIGLKPEINALLGLYVKIHPYVPYSPFLAPRHPETNLALIHENEEDLSMGMEYQQTPHVCQAVRLTSRMACERTIQYAFEFARKNGRKEVACFANDHLLRRTDGLFHHVFDEIALQYPDILNEYWPVAHGAAKLMEEPQNFDVVVLPRSYGEILSAQMGPSCSTSIGEHHALFESPSEDPFNLLLAIIQMLTYLGQVSAADHLHQALFESMQEANPRKKLGTSEWKKAVIERLGKNSSPPKAVRIAILSSPPPFPHRQQNPVRQLIGVDVTIYHKGPLSLFFSRISHIAIGPLRLKKILNRETRVWPEAIAESLCIEQWICRFTVEEGRATSQEDVLKVLHAFDHVKIEVIKADFLCKGFF